MIGVGQTLVNGLLLGGLYAAAAVGFSLVWGIMNLVNLAHGSFIMLGAYVVFWCFTLWHVDPFLALPIAMAALFALGFATQWLLVNQILRAPLLMTLLLFFGISLVVTDVAYQLWSPSLRTVQLAYGSAGLHIGPIIVPFVRLAALTIAVALTGALSWYLNHTRGGLAILATGLDQEAARLVGINPRYTYAMTFAIGAAFAGAAGVLVAIVYPISPTIGDPYTLRSFVVVVLGGVGNVWGAVLGGLLFGVVQAAGGFVFGSGFEDAIAFGVMVLVLLIRPQGLIGRPFYSTS
ncbi:MAG TPA: branched-chain amino acid ABC transporter permease [Chloroflexota bacterium]|nr:branched-chain amino acid ABC transporter permease [Chloroflexota bacterium]